MGWAVCRAFDEAFQIMAVRLAGAEAGWWVGVMVMAVMAVSGGRWAGGYSSFLLYLLLPFTPPQPYASLSAGMASVSECRHGIRL